MSDLSTLAINASSGFLDEMAWAEPENRPEVVNRAGRTLVQSMQASVTLWTPQQWADFDAALAVINNWRASHGYPLNTFQVNLRRAARRVDPSALVAQRTKRLASIASKLERFPRMKLTQMQDIEGCRAVVKGLAEVRSLERYYRHTSGIKHRPAEPDDYITNPKVSGYRGIHLVYRYFSDKKESYNDLKIEMQIRSKNQHAWATAVETVGTFVQEALKSSMGSEQWLRFFALMSSVIAIREGTPTVPGTPVKRAELLEELAHLADELNVETRLKAYQAALRSFEEPADPDAHFYLLSLDAKATLSRSRATP